MYESHLREMAMSVWDVQEFDVISTELGGRCRRSEVFSKICVKMFIIFLRSVRFRRSEEVTLEASLATSRDAKGCFSLTADLFSNIENVSRIKDNLLG